MKRWIAGAFDQSASSEQRSRVSRALSPNSSSTVRAGALQVAYTGVSARALDPLCLFDGHLDNAAELSTLLEAPAGLTVEQLLALAWRSWAGGLLPRLRGAFALVVWDRDREEGLVARDQLGARSLFVSETPGGGVVFAGEVRYLLALLARRPAPDRASVAHWLTTSSRPGPATLYEGVRRLSPGCAIHLDRDGARERAYWTPRFRGALGCSNEDQAQLVGEALHSAVHRCAGGPGLTGVLMSGGLDSASVASVAAKVAPGRVRAYSATFPEHPAVDESALIDQLRDRLGLDGATVEVAAGGLLQSALDSIERWQLPLSSWGDFWALPLLRGAAAQGVTTMLGGDGGDELFAVRAYLLADRARAGRLVEAIALVGRLPGASSRPGLTRIARMAYELIVLGSLPHSVHDRLSHTPRSVRAPDWLLQASARELSDSSDPLAWKRLDGPRWWAHAAYGLTRGIEQSGVFEHHRRRSESAGVETRLPLLDFDLVELGLRLEPLSSFDAARNRPLLRAAMAGELPDAVRRRPAKARFDSLLIDCVDVADRASIQALLCDPHAELGAYADLGKLRETFFGDARLRREQPFQWMWHVWRMATAECWLRAQSGGVLPRTCAARVRRPIPTTPRADSYVFPP